MKGLIPIMEFIIIFLIMVVLFGGIAGVFSFRNKLYRASYDDLTISLACEKIVSEMNYYLTCSKCDSFIVKVNFPGMLEGSYNVYTSASYLEVTDNMGRTFKCNGYNLNASYVFGGESILKKDLKIMFSKSNKILSIG